MFLSQSHTREVLAE